jgi:hypothetical protein
MITLKDLIEKERQETYLPEFRSKVADTEVLGVMVARACGWSNVSIREVLESALEDANFRFEDLGLKEVDEN